MREPLPRGARRRTTSARGAWQAEFRSRPQRRCWSADSGIARVRAQVTWAVAGLRVARRCAVLRQALRTPAQQASVTRQTGFARSGQPDISVLDVAADRDTET